MGGKPIPIILLINGPNLNLLGRRDPKHYGSFTLEQVVDAFDQKAKDLGVHARFFQSNIEGEMINAIHEAMDYADGIVINAGAYTHYSYAIRDAIEACGLPVVEVHISDIHQREAFRNISVLLPVCIDQVSGLGLESYLVGLEKLLEHRASKNQNKAEPKNQNESIGSEMKSGENETESDEGEGESDDRGGTPHRLSEIRRAITKTDAELMEVFNKRMALSDQVAHCKSLSGKAVYDADREEEVSVLAQQMAEKEMGSRVDSLMKTVMRISRERQYDILIHEDKTWQIGRELAHASRSLESVCSVAYAGTEGSYSEQAAKKLFPHKEFIRTRTFSAASTLLSEQKADIAVLPLENTIVGNVDNVLELLQKKNLYIVRSTSIEVVHCLAVLPGTRIEEIRVVSSHPQGLAQCSEAIIQHGWETLVSDNTAFSAEEVSQKGDRSLAAISSKEAARRNKLEILPVDIRNADQNHTRFVAVAPNLVITPDADRISTLMHLPHRSGALVSALQIFADRGLNLTSISSRPIPGTPGEYAFFLDFMCPAMGRDALLSLYQLSSEMSYVKVLGWYVEQ